jgi:hypothetical protein
MIELIKYIIREETEKSIFNPMEIRLFKFVNKFKRDLGTEKKMLDFFESSLSTFNIPRSDARKYYDIYTLNYRPEGDYENVTTVNFKDPKRFSQQKKTSNTNARSFTKDKIPFKGSNLEGKWESTNDGEWAYIVYSYGWYPIYVFKYGRWFEIDTSYSSSTSKQMRHSYPISYNSDLDETTIIVDRNQMKGIINGSLKPENLMTTRTDEFINEMKKKQRTGEVTMFRMGWGDERVRIKFKVLSVRKSRKGYNIIVDIIDVDKIIDNKFDRDAGDFFNDEMIGISKDTIKKYMNEYFSSVTKQRFQGLVSDFYNIDVKFRGNN